MNEASQAIVDQTDWPKTEDEVTADALIKYFARIALSRGVRHEQTSREYFRAERDTLDRTEKLQAYLESLTTIIGSQQVTVLLAEAQKQDRDRADTLARVLWGYTEDGGLLSELMWDYLTDRGVDPQAVWDASESEAVEDATQQGASA
jgi:hypothetical protein